MRRPITILILTAGLGLVGASAAFVFFSQNGELPSLSGPRDWNPLCTCGVDANGDGVTDLAGFAGPVGSPYTPTLLDGRTGKELWHGKPATDEAWLFCLSPRWFGVARANFQVEIHDARHPARAVQVMGKDKLNRYALGKGCAELETDDGSKFGVALPSGTVTDCPSGAQLKNISAAPPGLIRSADKGATLQLGSRSYRLGERQHGTPMLTVEASEGKQSLWKKQLPYAASSDDAALAVGAGKVAVFGAKPGDRDHGLLVVLDQRSGKQQYVLPLPGRGTWSIGYLAFNGAYFVTAYFGSARAFDPASGKQVWHAGD